MGARKQSKEFVKHIDLSSLVGELILRKNKDGVVEIRLSADEASFFVALIEEQYGGKLHRDQASHSFDQMLDCWKTDAARRRQEEKDR